MADTAPFEKVISMTVPGQGTAGTDDAWNIGEVPFAGTVTAASYTPETAITGDGSNNRTFSIINKGQSGSGTTSVAAVTSTVTFPADDEKALTLSGTPANLVVAAGDILEFNSDAAGTGVVDPGGLVQVTITRN